MPPRGRPGSSHSSRPSSGSSHRPSSSHSSSSHHSSFSSHHSSSHHHSPSPQHHHHSSSHMIGAPAPPPPPPSSRGFRRSGFRSYRNGAPAPGGCSGCSGCAGLVSVFVIIVLIVGIVFFVRKYNEHPEVQQPQQSYSAPKTGSHDPIYVPALERKVQWNDEYDSYYDQPTDCYFFLNTDMEPPIWQYWYEGTSSDYGDYGWMEWDAQENRWYIETGETTWIPLPAGSEKNHFWHFD